MEQSAGGRPWVVVSVGMSVDGRVTLRRDSLLLNEKVRELCYSVTPPSSVALHAARESRIAELYQPQAVLEGSGSFVVDSTGPLCELPAEIDEPVDVLYADFLPEEIVERPGHEKWFAVVDSRGRAFWETKSARRHLDDDFDLLVLVARATPAAYLAHLRKERICYLVVGEERVDLSVAFRRMRERLGITCVESMAGGGINGALLRAGLIDEIHLLISPTAIGGLGTLQRSSTVPSSLPERLRRNSACSSSTPRQTGCSGCGTKSSATTINVLLTRPYTPDRSEQPAPGATATARPVRSTAGIRSYAPISVIVPTRSRVCGDRTSCVSGRLNCENAAVNRGAA